MPGESRDRTTVDTTKLTKFASNVGIVNFDAWELWHLHELKFQHIAVWKISHKHKQIKILRWWCRTTATNQVSYVLPCVVPPWTLVDSPPLYSPRLIFFSSSFHTGQDVWKQHNAVRLVACRRSLINSWWSKNQLQRRRVKWKHDTTNTTTLSNQIKLGCPASRHR